MKSIYSLTTSKCLLELKRRTTCEREKCVSVNFMTGQNLSFTLCLIFVGSSPKEDPPFQIK